MEELEKRSRAGYALFLIVAFLGGIVLLLSGMTLMLRIAHAMSDVQELHVATRQAAWNSAMLGLGKLQDWMGDDRRVSANGADFTAQPIGNRDLAQWVRNAEWIPNEDAEFNAQDWCSGAWDSDGNWLGWLMAEGDSGIWRELVPGIEVQLKRGGPTDEAESTGWLHSYWVSDEGGKSSIHRWQQEAQGQGSTSIRSVTQNPEVFLSEESLGVNVSQRAIDFGELLAREQLLFTDSEFLEGWFHFGGQRYDLMDSVQRKIALRELFHHTTLNHSALLTNPKSGGLKTNLWDAYDTSLTEWIHLRPPLNDSFTDYRMGISEQVYPVMTSLKLQYMLVRKNQQLYLRQRLFVRWWNPYTSTLVFPGQPVLAMQIHGLPQSIEIFRNGQPWESVELAAVVSGANPGSPAGGIRVLFPFPETDWMPGRTWHWVGQDGPDGRSFFNAPNMTNASLVRDYPLAMNGYFEYDLPGTLYELEYSAIDKASAGMRVELQVLHDQQWHTTQWITGEHSQGIEFEPAHIGPGTIDAVIPDNPSGGNMHVGYRVRMYESGYYGMQATARERGDWLWLDIRDRNLYASMETTGHYEYDADVRSLSSVNPEIGLDGPDYRRLDTRPISGPNALRSSMDFPLFEHVWEDPASLASLQHWHVEGMPAYSLGNPWGNDLNAIFDEYFLGFHEQSFVSEETHLRDYEGGDFAVVDGAFNVNSLSVWAWASLLIQKIWNDWEYVNSEPGQQERFSMTDLQRPWFRFTQTAHRLFANGLKSSGTTTLPNIPPREFFRRGVREFTSKQVMRLADAIVAEIRSYRQGAGVYRNQGGQPFLSVQEFVNAGIVHHAIARVGLNSLSALQEFYEENEETGIDKQQRDDPYGHNFLNQLYDLEWDEIWEKVPFHLSQADVLSAIDPLLTVRSDTWLIRGYAEKRYTRGNLSLGGVESTALVELVVQRVYELQQSVNEEFHRRFRILSVRWLDSF